MCCVYTTNLAMAFYNFPAAGLYAEYRHQVRLACAGIAHQHEVLVPVDVGADGQLLDEFRSDVLQPRQVEFFQRFVQGKVRLFNRRCRVFSCLASYSLFISARMKDSRLSPAQNLPAAFSTLANVGSFSCFA